MSERKWPTEQEIMDKQTPNGGWKRSVLAKWGVPWPPPTGWKKALIDRDQAFFTNLEGKVNRRT